MEAREPQFLPLDQAGDIKSHPPHHRILMTAVAATITAGGLSIALLLGTYGYDFRRSNMHNARLKGILMQTPTIYQVTEGLKEKAPLAEVVESKEQLDEAVARWGKDKGPQIREKAGSWRYLRIYSAGDMMYFIFFDDRKIMRDYIYVSL